MKQPGTITLPRRHFLRQLMVLGGATGASAIVLNNARLTATPITATRAHTDTTTPSKGYRLTEHIRTYYEKAQKI